ADRYSLSPDSVERHIRNGHVQGHKPAPLRERLAAGVRRPPPPEVIRERQHEAFTDMEMLIGEARKVYTIASQVVALAHERDDLGTMLGGIDRLQRGIDQLARLTGVVAEHIEVRTINIINSPEFGALMEVPLLEFPDEPGVTYTPREVRERLARAYARLAGSAAA
ncbi:MAG: hypothetical protein ACREQ5_26025, partial [Candidatus Dormibacteria bacterium]